MLLQEFITVKVKRVGREGSVDMQIENPVLGLCREFAANEMVEQVTLWEVDETEETAEMLKKMRSV